MWLALPTFVVFVVVCCVVPGGAWGFREGCDCCGIFVSVDLVVGVEFLDDGDLGSEVVNAERDARAA